MSDDTKSVVQQIFGTAAQKPKKPNSGGRAHSSEVRSVVQQVFRTEDETPEPPDDGSPPTSAETLAAYRSSLPGRRAEPAAKSREEVLQAQARELFKRQTPYWEIQL